VTKFSTSSYPSTNLLTHTPRSFVESIARPIRDDCLHVRLWSCRPQLLRMTAMLSTTALFIPLMSTMLHVFACDSTWLSTGWQCFQGVHLVLVFAVACIALLFAGFALIGPYSFRSKSLVELPLDPCCVVCTLHV
jgi:hypothetical protein